MTMLLYLITRQGSEDTDNLHVQDAYNTDLLIDISHWTHSYDSALTLFGTSLFKNQSSV